MVTESLFGFMQYVFLASVKCTKNQILKPSAPPVSKTLFMFLALYPELNTECVKTVN